MTGKTTVDAEIAQNNLSLNDLRELAAFDAALTDEDLVAVDARLEPDRGRQYRIVLAAMARSGKQLAEAGSGDGLEILDEMTDQVDDFLKWLKASLAIAEVAQMRLMAVGAYAEALHESGASPCVSSR